MKPSAIFAGIIVFHILVFCGYAQQKNILESKNHHFERLNLKVNRLSENAITISVAGQYANQLALSTDKGIVVFDSHWSRSAAAEYQEVIAKEFNRNDFAYVILTGSRIIRVAGTPQYPDATVIALDRCYESMLQNKSRLEELVKQD